jgi:cytochrome c556
MSLADAPDMRIAELACVAVGLVAGSCQATGERDPPALAQKVVAARERMHARFAAAKAAEVAIALGDLERAHGEAHRIATQDEPDFLPEWRPYLDEIRATAARIETTPDTMTAAKTMAQLGRECARCHEATDAKIAFARELVPPTEMASHQWAAARMWEGVIGPSEDRWLAGAHALSGAPLTLTAESGQLGIADDAARVKLLAQRALKPDDRDERANLFGDLLATCAHCHAVIRDREMAARR